MHPPCLRVFIGLTVIFGSIAIANAASLDIPNPKSRSNQVTYNGPCRTAAADTSTLSEASWRARLSRANAIYVIQHVQKACHILADGRDRQPPAAPSISQLNSILDGLYAGVLGPIYRAHPDLSRDLVDARTEKPRRATPRDIQRTTATRLSADLSRLQRAVYALGGKELDKQSDENAAERARLAFLDAGAELSFAEKIAFDAYPGLFAKKFDTIPPQPRTEESDASFRKHAPPRGSVKLSDAASALIKSFMQQARRAMPKVDHVASIGWASAQKSKGPGDADWIDRGPGWVFGAYARTQVPPDVIDKVDDIEIVFSADDPSRLAGKIVDAKDQKVFVRE